MRAAWRNILVVCTVALAMTFVVETAAADADAVIRGVVTDNAGKPIRGAMVKATRGYKDVTRFTQNDGRYEIAIPAGTYDVSVEAFGFGVKKASKDTTQGGDTNFTLSPQLSLARLTGAELESLLPNEPQAHALTSQCISCHTVNNIMMKRGSTAAEWEAFIPTMTRDRFQGPRFNAAEMDGLGKALEKYFGPNSPVFGPDAEMPKIEQVKHANISDQALRATIREYTTPAPNSMPHSITVDGNGTAWFSEYDYPSNRLVSFDPGAEKFHEVPAPLERSQPHTGAMSKDGRTFYVPVSSADLSGKLYALDTETYEVKTYDFPGHQPGTHSAYLDPTGSKVWLSIPGGNNEVWSFDVKTHEFKDYKYASPAAMPADSIQAMQKVTGGSDTVRANNYDITVDSKGKVYFSLVSLGEIMSLDPATGKTQIYSAPGIASIRGITVDPQDNVWFCAFSSHQLGRLDAKTGAIKLYRPPTELATPYGAIVDHRTGHVWFADMSGNHITDFDPTTEKFVEYPIPTRNANSRFIAVDGKGRVWFTEFFTGKIGMVDPDGGKQIASR